MIQMLFEVVFAVIVSLFGVLALSLVVAGLCRARANAKFERQTRLLQKQPLLAVKPIPCPVCEGTEHNRKTGGLWDGAPDPITGRRPCGIFAYGICKTCNSRWAKWDDAPPYVPSDEEWYREVVAHDPELLWARGHDPLL